MKPGTDTWKKRVNVWAKRTVRGVNGDKIFRSDKPTEETTLTRGN